MNQIEQQKAAREFSSFWRNKGDEKQESQRFWIDLLQNVLGIANPTKYIEFEKRVQLLHTSYIDAYIADTKVLIEQKGSKIDLHKGYEQSDGSVLTAFEQAKRYADEMPNSLRPRWIVVCNFQEFLIYDMEKPHSEPEEILLKDLEKDYYRLQFLVDQKNENIRREEEISIEAGKLVDKLYRSLLPQYYPHAEDKGLSAFQLRSLNILCVRIVFCLYAEDTGLFATRTAFEDYIRGFNLPNVRIGLVNLFKALDTPLRNRDEYDESLKPFPYVNGGLFKDENIEIPGFTQEIVNVITNDCATFNWSDISPTIFGAVFESTLNPETRRKGGMHYTSIENIHKVIDPLFMDNLNEEFEQICKEPSANKKSAKLHEFQKKLGSLTFLDPACGSGNFLTETYLSLRRLENKVISILNKGEKAFGFDEFIYVHIGQFYGIEINDFAVTVAKTALWIAESQMVAETEAILSQTIDFLPLTTNASIIEGNALKIDWATLASTSLASTSLSNRGSREDSSLSGVEGKELPLFEGFTTKVDGTVHRYDYIMGNPPFVGYSLQSDAQKKDILSIYVDEKGKPYKTAGKIDYVSGWYFKAAQLIRGTGAKCAFVSTNSITQGEQVAAVWKPIFERFGIGFDFAYRTFRWDSESTEKAHVHCVIIGFSHKTPLDHNQAHLLDSNQAHPLEHNQAHTLDRNQAHTLDHNQAVCTTKRIFNADGTIEAAQNINGYLLNADNVWIESRAKPICDVAEMIYGNKPTDGGFLFLTEDERNDFLRKEPNAEHFIKQILGSEEFINGKKRYCLWLVDASPAEIRKMPKVLERVEAVRAYRLKSTKEATRKSADYATVFQEVRQPKSGNYLLIPRVSSERRRYVPIGFLSYEIIVNDAVQIIPNATLYHFGVLTSSVHMAWMRAVCGRLKSDYRYSKDIVYNNFVFPSVEKQSYEFSQSENSQHDSSKQTMAHPCALQGQPVGTQEQAAKIEQTAQAILEARAKYPDSSLADLYDETLMPADLRKAHRANDRAVMEAYGFNEKMSEADIVAALFALYEELTAKAK
ncbi:MAG: methylase [Treponema sp.]|nr:methylase [Treponema sp.]